MAKRHLYFAYGSNLSVARLRARCPQAATVGKAILPNHALEFGGHSAGWGGAVATVVRCPGAQVEGILYMLTRADLFALDGYEGHPRAYRRQQCRVLNEYGHWRHAFIYVQPASTEPAAPPIGYLAVIAQEYRRLGFDMGALAVATYGGAS